ncbi:iron complex transport system substrate-binding protein [Rhizobium alvei]
MMQLKIRRRLLPALLALCLGMGADVWAEDKKPLDLTRLVSVGGAVTEIVYDLGYGDKLVARDTTSTFPEAAMKLPDVGYMRALSPEGVLSVNPTAILMIEGSGPPTTVEVLKKAAIPTVTIPEGFDREAILTKIRAVGAALGADEKAEELAAKVGADIDAARKAVADIPDAKRKRVLFVLSLKGGKINAAGAHTAADGIVKLAGGLNAVGDYSGYKPLNDEAIINAKPDFILMMHTGGPMGASDEEILAHPAIAQTPAGKNRAILRLPGMPLLGFGPRTADAIRQLSASLYGG